MWGRPSGMPSGPGTGPGGLCCAFLQVGYFRQHGCTTIPPRSIATGSMWTAWNTAGSAASNAASRIVNFIEQRFDVPRRCQAQREARERARQHHGEDLQSHQPCDVAGGRTDSPGPAIGPHRPAAPSQRPGVPRRGRDLARPLHRRATEALRRFRGSTCSRERHSRCATTTTYQTILIPRATSPPGRCARRGIPPAARPTTPPPGW